jgi:hypothetical protein
MIAIKILLLELNLKILIIKLHLVKDHLNYYQINYYNNKISFIFLKHNYKNLIINLNIMIISNMINKKNIKIKIKIVGNFRLSN